jgi:DNA-binding FadR family transcriptional regulator
LVKPIDGRRASGRELGLQHGFGGVDRARNVRRDGVDDRLDRLVAGLIELSTPADGGALRLPPERELGEALSMSRGALREQLATLENLGVLRRRQGHGTYIDAPDASFLRTSFVLMRRLGYLNDEQFTTARELLEETVAAEAARRATDADVVELRSIVTDLVRHSANGDDDAALEADLALHNRLFRIVDNPVFTMLNQGISHVLRENVRERRTVAAERSIRDEDGAIATDTVHGDIVDALQAHDPDLARAAMRRHFEHYARVAGPTDAPIGSAAPLTSATTEE